MLSLVNKEKAEEILDYFGKKPQLIKVLEEMGELTQLITRHLNKRFNKANAKRLEECMKEEACDVLVMLTQLFIMLDTSEQEISEIVDYKLTRTLENINSDFYE